MTILYDQFGREIERADRKAPERRPLAVAPVLDSFRDYVADGLTPERLATVFKQADSGDVSRQASLFEQLEERDAHLLCERDKRKNVILDLDFKVVPASDNARDVRVAEFVEDFLDDLADWDDVQVSLQDAIGKGYSSFELFWDVSEGQAVVEKFEFIEQKRFVFTDGKGLLRRWPRLLTDADLMGVEIPAWKVLFHNYGGKSGSPTRSGIYRVAAWMVLFKNYSIKDWVIFCELFGMPLRIGRYEQGATEGDRSALAAAISSLGSDAAGIISKSTEIEFIQTAKTAQGDLWKLLASFCNGEMSKAILGQTLTADVDGKGSYAASKTHNEVRLDLLRSDGRALAATVRSQLIRPLVGFNFGWDTELPKYRSIFDEGEDLGAKATWIGELIDRGMPVGVSYMREQFSLPEPEEGEEILSPGGAQTAAEGLPGKPAAGGSAAPADGGKSVAKLFIGEREVDLPGGGLRIVAGEAGLEAAPISSAEGVVGPLTEKLLDQTDTDSLVEPIRRLLDEVQSLEEFRDRLVEVYADMSPAQLGTLIERGLVLAELSGRFDVRQENA